MNRKIKVIIADDNDLIREMIADSLQEDADIEIVAQARDGNQTLEVIREFKPDVVLLDLVMPNADGMDVMERVITDPVFEGNKPYFIIISAAGREDIISHALQAGASYFFMKPFSGEALIKRIKQLCSAVPVTYSVMPAPKNVHAEPQEGDMENEVVLLMRSMNVPVKMIGYKYLRDAIMLAYEDPESLMSVTKDVYPKLAEKYGTSPTNVERNIRYAIESTWARNRKSSRSGQVDRMFGTLEKKPTNSEFVLTCSEWLKYKDI